MKMRHSVFWPPFLMVFGALTLNFIDPSRFLALVNGINQWVLGYFSSWFAFCGIGALLVSAAVYFSPIGKTKMGGPEAKPLLSLFSWACVSVCVNTGAGILFWGMAEPIYHLTQPPVSLGLPAGSPEAARFAMSTLFMHWSFTPAALFALPGLLFGLVFYNLGLPFSLSSCLEPLVGKKWREKLSAPVDVIALYTLVLGMAASLATGVLTVSGGVAYLTGKASAAPMWIGIGIAIVVTFLLSAALGLDKGIKNLSLINSYFLIFLALFVLVTALPSQALHYGWTGLTEYLSTFLARSTFAEFAASDPWPRQWPVFYWAVWLAWAPISAGFLGRIGVGYTVRQFLWVNLLIPAFFALLWMTIFGGTSLGYEMNGAGLSAILNRSGAENLTYTVLAKLPWSSLIIPVFLGLAAISYVTAADSNTVTMAAMSTTDFTADSPEPPLPLKIVWGVLVGTVSLVMLVHSGIEGIKTLSYLGGLPALFFEIAAGLSLVSLAWAPQLKRLTEIFSKKATDKGDTAWETPGT